MAVSTVVAGLTASVCAQIEKILIKKKKGESGDINREEKDKYGREL